MEIKELSRQFCDYSRFIKGYSNDTIKRYRHVISYYSSLVGINDISQVTDDNVRRLFFYGRTEKNWSPNTFICYHKSLMVFFRWCVQEGHMARNPITDIEVPKLEKKLPAKLTQQDAFRLLEIVYNYPYKYRFLRYRNQAIFAVFLFAGLRKKELLRLKYTDIDLESLAIFINQGKGGKDRIIPIGSKLAEILQKYLIERKRLGKTCPEFFASLNRNIGLTETGLKRLAAKMSEVSGIKFSIHKLRHTFATLMLEGGCDIYSLSRMMGHSDIKTTTIYLAASAEHLRSQMTKHPLNNDRANR